MPEIILPPLTVFRYLIKIWLFCCFALSVFQSHAATFHYQATDLTDTSVDEDLWRYTYTISNHNFSMNNGFSLFFDPILYADLQNPTPSAHAEWDVLLIQPDVFTPDDGIYDALTWVNSPSLLTLFSVDFVWLGAAMPASQPFEIYDSTFNVLTSGNTLNTPASVPVPPVGLLLGTGILMMAGFRKTPASFVSRIVSMPQENNT